MADAQAILTSLIQAVVGAFQANPVYSIVLVVVGLLVGWFMHWKIFGY